MPRILPLTVLAATLWVTPCLSRPLQQQEQVDTAAGQVVADSVAAVAIDVSEVADQAAIITSRLRTIDAAAQPNQAITSIETEWPGFSSKQDELSSTTDDAFREELSEVQLNEFLRQWLITARQLGEWSTTIDSRVEELSRDLSEVEQAREAWTLTKTATAGADASELLLTQIDNVLASLNRVADKLEGRLGTVRELDSRVTFSRIEAEDVQERLTALRDQSLADRISRRDVPIWALFSEEAGSSIASGGLRIVEGARITGRYLADHLGYIGIHIGLFLVLTIAFRLIRKRVNDLAETDSTFQGSERVFEKYVLPAALVSLLATQAIYPIPPFSLITFAAIFSIPLTIYLLKHQLPGTLHGLLYGVGTLVLFFVVARTVVPTGTVAERLSTFLTTVAGVGGAAWFLRPGGSSAVLKDSRIGRFVISACKGGLVILLISLVADIIGYSALALHGLRTSINAMYFGLYFYIGALIVAGTLAAFVESRFAQSSRAIKANAATIRKRLTGIVFLGAGLYWLYMVIRALGLSEPLFAAIADLLGRPFGIGGLQFSLLDVLAFVITLWISLKGAQILRAILDEDVLGRMDLPRGIPVAVSGLTFYVLVALGFLFALSAAGVPLDRLALITGALGIGIGFGLQDIVRNFISGLILMIERPVKVGDTIEFGTEVGVITKVGIRSSVVRSLQGADVIVPNGHLVANQVKNWTMADSSRRIDVNLTVAFDSDVELVRDILLSVASNFEGIESDPAPAVQIEGFGSRGLNFSLRCWVRELEGWIGKRTELSARAQARLKEAGVQFPTAPAVEVE